MHLIKSKVHAWASDGLNLLWGMNIMQINNIHGFTPMNFTTSNDNISFLWVGLNSERNLPFMKGSFFYEMNFLLYSSNSFYFVFVIFTIKIKIILF